jgi:signal transduction histidine kinase
LRALATKQGSHTAVRAPRWQLAAVSGLAVAVSTLTVLVVTSGTPPADSRPLRAIGHVLVILVPVAVGLWSWSRRPQDRFGRLLVATGFISSFTGLTESSDDVLYSIGRTGSWLAEAALVYVMLAFPSGHLTERKERVVAWAAVLTATLLYVPSAVFTEQYPVPSPWSSCDKACPGNAFMVSHSQPAFVDSVLRPLREVVTSLLFFAVAVLLARRVRRATPLMRRTLTPVLALATLRSVLFPAFFAVRTAGAEGPTAVVGWMELLCIPGMALGFLVGLERWRVFAGDALQRLALRLPSALGPPELRAALADAVQDPSLQLAYWIPGRPGYWADCNGRALSLPQEGSGRSVTEVRDRGRLISAVVHDAALADQRVFVDAVASYAMTALDNQRLAAKLESSLREVQHSRARIMSAADSERRRIERDLHDGAQQRLVALRVRLELADELMKSDPARGVAMLHDLGSEAEQALEEVRSLARGIYPSLLADHGLSDALRSAALYAAIPTTVDTDGAGRYPPDVESAVYFCCLEALQNAVKHARGATSVAISVIDDGALRFAVIDNGAGFTNDGHLGGKGLTNMRDRIAAIGGQLVVHARPSGGTKVAGTVPLSAGSA